METLEKDNCELKLRLDLLETLMEKQIKEAINNMDEVCKQTIPSLVVALGLRSMLGENKRAIVLEEIPSSRNDYKENHYLTLDMNKFKACAK